MPPTRDADRAGLPQLGTAIAELPGRLREGTERVEHGDGLGRLLQARRFG